MQLRELIVAVLFKVNPATVKQTDEAIGKVKEKLAGVEKQSQRTTVSTQKSMQFIRQYAYDTGSGLDVLIGRFNRLAALMGVSFTFGSFIRIADQWKSIEGTIKNVTSSEREAASVQNELFQIANRTRQAYASTAGLFSTVARSAGELGKTNDEVLLFTEDVANAMLLGQTSASAQQAALIQLGQALGSGVLRGDELNSILEQAPMLARTIAEGMGTTQGQLRRLGQEGKITAAALFDAVRSQSAKLKMQLGTIPWTVSQATVLVANAVGRLFHNIEKRTGIGGAISKNIASLAELINGLNVDRVVASLEAAGIAAGVFFAIMKWGTVAQGARTFLVLLEWIASAFKINALATFFGSINAGFTGAAASAAVFQAGMIKASAMAMLAFAKLLVVPLMITTLIIALEDLYTWFRGGNSVIGHFFGSFEGNIDKLSTRWEQWKTEFGKSLEWFGGLLARLGEWFIDVHKKINPFFILANFLLDILKDIYKYLDDMFGIGEGLADTFKPWFGSNEGKLDAGRIAADSETIRNNMRNINNSGNTTNYVTIHAKTMASAEDIGNMASSKLTPAPAFGDIDFDYTAVEMD